MPSRQQRRSGLALVWRHRGLRDLGTASFVFHAMQRALASGLPAVLDCRTRFVPHPAGPMFGAMNKFGFEALTRLPG